MSPVALLAIVAAALFAAYHVPIPRRRDGVLIATTLAGVPARLCGIGYHLALLPVIAALPAPTWARAAGFAWMLLDILLNASQLIDPGTRVGALRDGVHVIAIVFLLGAGVFNGVGLGVLGALLAAAFLIRFVVAARHRVVPRSLLHVNAALNVAWMIGMAVRLW